MTEFLIGIMYHEPESYAHWNSGLVEDYESSVGILIEANSSEEAIAWAGHIGQSLLSHVNDDDTLDWNALGYFCWWEEATSDNGWTHWLNFFQHVKVGEMPDLDKFTTAWSTSSFIEFAKRLHRELYIDSDVFSYRLAL